MLIQCRKFNKVMCPLENQDLLMNGAQKPQKHANATHHKNRESDLAMFHLRCMQIIEQSGQTEVVEMSIILY